MKVLLLVLICFSLTSCAAMIPSFLQTAEDIINDEAIQVIVSREALQESHDINIVVDVKAPVAK